MVDSLDGALSIVWVAISEAIRSIGKDDAVALLLGFVAGAGTITLRDLLANWTRRYGNRFVRWRMKRIAVRYAFSLAATLFASALIFSEFRDSLPGWALWAAGATALAAFILFSFLGWRARGPTKPGPLSFARIFYEPTTVVVSPLLVPKLSTIIGKAPEIWRQIAEISLRFMG